MVKKILITWWTGFIGSHAVVEFEKAWYETVIVDNLCNSSIDVLDGIQKIISKKPAFHKIDLRDKIWLQKIFSEHKFDGVIHFAGLKAVGESCQKPDLYFDNNIVGSICLFNVMKEYGVKNIVFSSSCTVYWDPQEIPLKETTQLSETSNPYGRTKQLLEKILADYSKFAWFNVINLRYFNPIWAHPTWFIWESLNWTPSNLFPYILKVVKWELEYLNVYWLDYPTIDWTWVRDYIDIMDLIEWHLKAYKYLGKPTPSLPYQGEGKTNGGWFFEIFNLWVGKGVSVLEMVRIVERVSWKKVPYKVVWRREWDLSEVYADSNKAEKVLWWKVERWVEESVKNWLRFYGIV